MPVYVQHEVLGKVQDVFNAEALWQAPGLALFARRPLLRDLLERSPREQRGRAATRCFSHVTLMLPQDDVDDDRHLTRGARVRDLAASLAALHQKDFGDLLGADEVRYDVVGADSLQAGQVEVRFGHAVYLPAPDEAVLYQLATSSDTAIWHNASPIYRNQRLALIGKDALPAGRDGAFSPFDGAGLADSAILLINDGPDTPLEVQVRPKAAFDCSYDAVGGYYVIRSKPDAHAGAASGKPLRLLLKVTRVGAPARTPHKGAAAAATTPSLPARSAVAAEAIQLKSAAVWKTRARVDATPAITAPSLDQTAMPARARAPAPDGDSIDTIDTIDTADAVNNVDLSDAVNAVDAVDATYAPLAQQRVTLAALALPRLSRYRDTGAAALEIGFDQALALAAPGVEPVISFAVDAADELVAITRAGRERISTPSSFTPVDGASVRLSTVAAEMADRYRALLILPAPPGLPVAPGARFVFGRGAPMLAGLRVLDSPRFVHHAHAGQADGVAQSAKASSNANASADRIGLSRQAFSFEATAAGYQIGRLSATQALYHLDEHLNFVAAIGGGADGLPYLLPPGHHLVAGHYVLRFDA